MVSLIRYPLLRSILEQRTCNWVASSLALDTPLPRDPSDSLACLAVSAGSEKQSKCVHSSMMSVFSYFDECEKMSKIVSPFVRSARGGERVVK